jgi:hypothetical protein
MTTDNVCLYLQNRLIQTSQTGGQQYSDTSSFSIPWLVNYHYHNNLKKSKTLLPSGGNNWQLITLHNA